MESRVTYRNSLNRSPAIYIHRRLFERHLQLLLGVDIRFIFSDHRSGCRRHSWHWYPLFGQLEICIKHLQYDLRWIRIYLVSGVVCRRPSSSSSSLRGFCMAPAAGRSSIFQFQYCATHRNRKADIISSIALSLYIYHLSRAGERWN